MVETALNFVNEILSEIDRLKRQEPFPINLLEEVHLHDDGEDEYASNVKENAHSRILRSLLSFRYEDKYVLLNSLIQYIIKISGASSQWKAISIESPEKPVNEMGRIDLLIHEKGKYALIFENKINNAGDQPNQIARYIEFVKSLGYEEEQIYILYLSSKGENPSDQTWIHDETGKDYKISFMDRYVNLSYKKDILPWLREASHCIQKMPQENLLTSALIQYINYLEIKYMQRPIDNSVKKAICSKLELDKKNKGEQLKTIIEQSESTMMVKDYLDSIKTDLLIDLYISRFQHLNLVQKKDYSDISAQDIDLAFSFEDSGSKFYAVLYRYNKGANLCLGLFPSNANRQRQISEKLLEKFSELNLSKGSNRYYKQNLSGYECPTIIRFLEIANEIAMKGRGCSVSE